MIKYMYRVLGFAVLCSALFAFEGTQEASAGVQVNINIVAPPPLQFAEPPDVYVVPSGTSYVYMVPDYDGVYFYGGNWYRFYNDRWFRSSDYNGEWIYIEQSIVPHVIYVLPPEYIHYVPTGYYRIHYDDFHSNWRSWDERRHWDRYDWYQYERRDDIRRERYNHIERDRQHRDVQQPQRHHCHALQSLRWNHCAHMQLAKTVQPVSSDSPNKNMLCKMAQPEKGAMHERLITLPRVS